MTIVLLIVGLLATAAGFVTIGFGIPINAFSLGNTLIIAGTISVATGLILIGLAAALGQLRRIAADLNPRPAARANRTGESVEPLMPPSARLAPSPAPMRVPTPPKPPEGHAPPAPEPSMPEPLFPATAASEPPGPLDWLRSKPRAAAPAAPPSATAPHPAEPPMVDLTDEAPLSPRTPQRGAPPPAPMLEPKAGPPSRNTTAEPRTAPRAEQPMPRATPQVELPKDKDDFNLVWPDRGAVASEPATRSAAPEMPTPPPRPREGRPAERRADVSPKPPSERGPAILKSGVIDGMPYTLYADGSIEAELPQGTVKFASVDALRAHLEKQS